jgi:hypothetical protein
LLGLFELFVEGVLENAFDYFLVVLLGVLFVESGGFVVERGGGVRVCQQLGQKYLNHNKGTSKMLTSSYIGVHVWLMTSKQTEPELNQLLMCTRSQC